MTRRANRRATAASVGALVICLALALQTNVVDPDPGGGQQVTAELMSGTVPPGWTPGPQPGQTSRGPNQPPEAPVPPPLGMPPETGGPSDATAGTDNVLRFVYFVEQDQEADPASVELIAEQAAALQQLWYDQFGGTFVVADAVDVVYGDHPADWYDTTPIGDDPRWYRLTNIRDEIERRLDLDPDDPSTRFVAYPHTRIDGRVGANRYRSVIMDGDDLTCISGRTSTTPYSPDYPANCLATVAHELGHVFGLSHQGPDEDCMQFGFYQYMSIDTLCRFSATNRSLVINDPYNRGWLDARPGEFAPPPEPTG